MQTVMSSPFSAGINSTSPSKAPSILLSPSGIAHRPATYDETIRKVEHQIQLFGPGPHSPQRREDLSKLNNMLQRAKLEQQKMLSVNKVSSDGSITIPNAGMITVAAQPTVVSRPANIVMGGASVAGAGEGRILDKRRLQELVKEVDPLEQLDDDVEEVLLQMADDFIENVVMAACQIAKHRRSTTLEVKDVQLHLERNWNMWVPGFGSEEFKPLKKSSVTEAHKQRMALIRKTLKKY